MSDQPPREGEILFYSGPDGTTRLEVLFEDESFWLTQKRMADLFDVDVRTISEHLKTIFSTGELSEESVIRKFRITAADGKSYLTGYYNLDAIIAVGYRVNSRQATQFRQWSTSVLRDYIIKGFVLDDERLKHGTIFGKDYFDELLERIREIRASERRFYQKITDIYQQCSIDYDKDSDHTRAFFKQVQNKLHWAVSGKTAPQIVAEGADASKPTMGLKTWKNAPDGKILKADVSIAKNYLNEDTIKSLERIVSMYLDYAENQAARQIPMKMTDWTKKLDAFLTFNEYEILTNAGPILMRWPRPSLKLNIKNSGSFRITLTKTILNARPKSNSARAERGANRKNPGTTTNEPTCLCTEGLSAPLSRRSAAVPGKDRRVGRCRYGILRPHQAAFRAAAGFARAALCLPACAHGGRKDHSGGAFHWCRGG